MSTLYTDICYSQEQLIDYCDMIAEALIRYDSETGDNGTADTANDERMRKQIHEIFRDKFEVLENISALEESGEKTGIALFWIPQGVDEAGKNAKETADFITEVIEDTKPVWLTKKENDCEQNSSML